MVDLVNLKPEMQMFPQWEICRHNDKSEIQFRNESWWKEKRHIGKNKVARIAAGFLSSQVGGFCGSLDSSCLEIQRLNDVFMSKILINQQRHPFS